MYSCQVEALMLPPGLSFVAYNHRAQERFKAVKTPRFYLNLNKYFDSIEQNSTHSHQMLDYLERLTLMLHLLKEGFNNTIHRHYLIRDGLRESLKALDLNLLVTNYTSPTVTSFIPHDKDN